MFNLDVITVWVLHFWMLSIVTIAIGSLWLLAGKRSLKYWFLSDLAALASLTMFYSGDEYRNAFSQIAFPLMAWLTMYLRVVVSQPNFVHNIQRYVLGCGAGLLGFGLVMSPNVTNSLVAANNFAYSILSILMIVGLLRNKDLHFTFGSVLVIASTFMHLLMSVFRGVKALHTPDTVFSTINMTTNDASGAIIIVGSAVTFHIGVIVTVFDSEMHRSQMRSVEQAAREAEGREQAEKRQLEIQRISEEQKALIEVLTHEVRQPLNNASAALQSITHELDDNRTPHQMEAVLRAQTVIDNVNTALSNALVAATILERQHKFYPTRCEPVAIAEIVALDFNRPDRERLKIEAKNAPLFVTVDPILMRIALRNLFDNALRYAPAGSDILVEICEDETRMGVMFNVSNQETNPGWTDGIDIFARRVRGKNTQISGSGMGLYIAAEIAKLHNGSLTTHSKDGTRVFSLFLSD